METLSALLALRKGDPPVAKISSNVKFDVFVVSLNKLLNAPARIWNHCNEFPCLLLYFDLELFLYMCMCVRVKMQYAIWEKLCRVFIL